MSSTSAAGILACSTVLPVLAIGIVGLRFYYRLTQKLPLKFEDWAQAPALAIFVAMGAIAIFGVERKAFGYPTPPALPTEPPATMTLCEKLWFVLQILSVPCMGLIKLAALSFYRQLFVTGPGPLNIIIWLTQAIVVSWIISFEVAYVAICGSYPQAAWGGWLPFAEHCLRSEAYEQAFAISAFLLDTIVLIIPLPSIWRLQMASSKKLALSGVFLIALVGYGASIGRLATFVELTNYNLAHAHELPDIQSTDTQAAWFSMLEIGFTLIALNVPAVWGVLRKASLGSFMQSFKSLLEPRSSRKTGSYPLSGGDMELSQSSSRYHSDSMISGVKSKSVVQSGYVSGEEKHEEHVSGGIVVRQTLTVNREESDMV